MITHSKTGYCKRHPKHIAVFNAQIFIRKKRLLDHVDLDLSLDAERLATVARAIGENLFVLEEMEPYPFHQPGELPMAQVLRHAIWWTRTRSEDQDIFTPVGSKLWKPSRRRLTCTTWTWQGRPAYAINVWNNPEWHNSNMVGAAVELWGSPLMWLRPDVNQNEEEHFNVKIAAGRGRPVRPEFYQRSGPLEYVWFSHGVAFPAVFFDGTIRRLDSVTYTHHCGHKAIHVRQNGKLIGLIWPCDIWAPEVVRNARFELQRLRRERATKAAEARPNGMSDSSKSEIENSASIRQPGEPSEKGRISCGPQRSELSGTWADRKSHSREIRTAWSCP
jgi:hypothetical protein